MRSNKLSIIIAIFVIAVIAFFMFYKVVTTEQKKEGISISVPGFEGKVEKKGDEVEVEVK